MLNATISSLRGLRKGMVYLKWPHAVLRTPAISGVENTISLVHHKIK